MEAIGESLNEYRGRRKWRKGHALDKTVDEKRGTFYLKCRGEGCNWFYLGFIDNAEPAEQAGYMHISTPELLVPGSSDILKATRLFQMQEAERLRRKG